MIPSLRRKEYKLADAFRPPVIGLAFTAPDLIRRFHHGF